MNKNVMADFTQKFRPQTISDLDLALVREGLSKVLKSGRIPQAFLFTGPRGTGKTSAARIIAKSVNCLAKKGFEPCNQCEQCRTIIAGANLDVLEIDAASSRGIDDIRDLREKIKLAPSTSSYKVYIIDEVHMLTLEAFNALLKTLEEPPKHAIFILCTTNPEKLPETIISRCMRFNFKRATKGEIVAKLKKIVKKEKIKIEEGVLEEIAEAVRGSFRDANRILEQASFSGEKVTREEIGKILDQTLGFEPEKFLELLVKKEVKAAIEEINEVIEKGGDLQVYTQTVLELLRRIFLTKIGVLPEEELSSFSFLLPEKDEIKKLLELFSKAAYEARGSLIPQLPLEIATAEYCFGEEGKRNSSSLPKKPEKAKTSFKHPVLNRYKPKDSPKKAGQEGQVSLAKIQARWSEVLQRVRPKNHSVEALLRATRPIELVNKSLVIEVFYQFHKDRLEEKKCRLLVEEAIKEIFGSPLFLKCVLGEKKVKKLPKEEIARDKMVSSQLKDDEILDKDIVAFAEEIFNGRKN